MRLLLLSNSTTHGYGYLEHAKPIIKEYFGNNIKKITFIPFAAVSFSYDEYTEKVGKVFEELGYKTESIHRSSNYIQTIESSEAIAIGGGNTFHLLHELHRFSLVEPIKDRVKAGAPYIGWSAGSNMACPSIKTTNDMPIIEPESFKSLDLIPFQINPHYTDEQIQNHHGETRDQRINEFLHANKNTTVVGLREGAMLKIENNNIDHIGNKQMKLFKFNEEPVEFNSGDDISFLL